MLTEYARKSFRFMFAKIYNESPINIMKTESFNAYDKLLKEYYLKFPGDMWK